MSEKACDGATCHDHDGERSHDIDCSASTLTEAQREFLRGHTLSELVQMALARQEGT